MKEIKSRIRNLTIKLIKSLISLINLDILRFAHSEIGIGDFGDAEKTGEKYLIKDGLSKYLSQEKKTIFFDIGANVGEYSHLLRAYYKKADIFSFEPNPRAYEILKKTSKEKNIFCENKGMGEILTPEKTLYSYKNLPGTQLGTTNREILKNYNIPDEIEEINFYSDTIDNYCSKNKIDEIDFVKIDVEGLELQVLKGAKELLKKNKIKVIQFEFNEPNISGRVFLKDFYNLLNNFEFYRLKKNSLLPLGEYNSKNEIFIYQNIIAINKKFISIN
ncbi:MAG: FkbM family methyltransferase [bacterium]